MTDARQSTIVQLLYGKGPALDFRGLVADLEKALTNCLPPGRGVEWDHDDMALVDLPGGRIVLSWATDLAGPHRAALSVSIGTGPEPERRGAGLARRQSGLVRMIAERVSIRHAPDALRWHRHDGPVTPELIDILTETRALADLGAATLPEATPLTAACLARTLAGETGDAPEGPDRTPGATVIAASGSQRTADRIVSRRAHARLAPRFHARTAAALLLGAILIQGPATAASALTTLLP